MFVTFVFISFALTQGNGNALKDLNKAISASIQEVLAVKYPDDQKLAKCMADDIASNFLTMDFMTNTEKFARDIEKYESRAKTKCKIGIFLESPIGVLALVVICLVLIIISCCIIKCIWC